MGVRDVSGRALVVAVTAVLVLTSTVSVSGQPVEETAVGADNQPTVNQLSGEELLDPENALIRRYPDRLEIEVRMPAPAPGTYRYPIDVPLERQAPPEVFTAWAFVFNDPRSCVKQEETACGPKDFTEAARGGVYNLAGHITAIDHEGGAFVFDRGTDGDMVFRGTIQVGQTPRSDLPPDADATRHALDDPLNAEVHVAIAPHGQFVADTMPHELYEPLGNPNCGCWWVTFFVPGEKME